MSKRYRVTLTDTEREELEALITRRSEKAVPVKRAYILLGSQTKYVPQNYVRKGTAR